MGSPRTSERPAPPATVWVRRHPQTTSLDPHQDPELLRPWHWLLGVTALLRHLLPGGAEVYLGLLSYNVDTWHVQGQQVCPVLIRSLGQTMLLGRCPP